ncbi:MAG: hypothetical protein JW778_02000 [Candidatus Altiarchaeota archaeon]|nr:hypothetical protein [Candidatus Altiarchaeota archaeon]
MPKLTKVFDSINKEKPKITWFLRSDDQMKTLYGESVGPIKVLMDVLVEFKDRGDEIGWHPHLWRWDEKFDIWHQETDDLEWIDICLGEGYKGLNKYFDLHIVRMGWDFHSNSTMIKCDKLGLKADFSALPGLRNLEYVHKKSKLLQNTYDWNITQEDPYRPSTSDYRRPAINCEDSLSILEFPVTVFEIPLYLYVLKSIKNFSFDYRLRKSVMRITKDPAFFEPGARMVFKRAKEKKAPSFMCSYFHPDELLPLRGLFSISNFKRNLEIIDKLSREYNVGYKFLTASEAVENFVTYSGKQSSC